MHEETFRFWEALDAGSIPIIKAHATWEPLGIDHPIPTVASWDEVGTLLSELTADAVGGGAGESDNSVDGGSKIDQLQRTVSAWYQAFKQAHAAEFAAVISQVCWD